VSAPRVEVRKTYKLFIDGAFPRSESGRTYPVAGADGETAAWAVLASRKDLRDAVRAARAAQTKWAAATAYNRGQVLYRVAEILEGRASQLADELELLGTARADAEAEVDAAVDRWVWYAGWTDKIASVAGTVNPVAGPYFDFTVPEPTGVVGILAPDAPALLGLVSLTAPALCAGNAVVVVASESAPLPSVTLAEVLATSDVPAGVVNVLTGRRAELGPWLAGHGDVDAVDLTCAGDLTADLERLAADNVTRCVRPLGHHPRWLGDAGQSPYAITATMEMKSVWHPKGA
jgi:acyl-CoA reductase-like NAD-dependent aldehyde dehydrogenase